ncbi:carotenoid oxygenase [Calothrix sp. NIES-4071]|nr:carotenoid oxygenase [Calothrix sp. NIES-4071]BAZ64131.1 carotenoid oxygenase [Calothrix sp. NIES-4105]
MTATVNPSKRQNAWASVISQPAKEFPHTPLPTISGKIPSGLRGSLYRNGPGRLERGGVRMGHWFDGDGAILAVHFNDSGASAIYRYVQTAGYKEESAANKLIYGNYGMVAPGSIWDKLFKGVKNAANTSVLALPDKLLALWEGGKPHALNLKTLDTYSEDDLGGLDNNLPYSAHYKRAADTGEIYNFGVTPSLNSTLHIYKSTASGRIVQKAAHNIDGVPIVHDFVLAGQYLVFFISPVRVNLLAALTGSKCFSDALEWLPSKGTQIIVVDRQTLKIVSRGETEPWYQWHFSNGYVDANGAIIVDIARYDDFQTNQYLKEVATGETHTPAKSHLSRVSLNPQTGKVNKIEKILDCQCEFPNVPPEYVGKDSRYTYLSTFRPGTDISKEILNAIARYDHHTETFTIADVGENRYPSEPIYVKDLENASQEWVITVVYDGKTNASEVWIYNADRLNEEPVCKLELPGAVPHSFHGTWK